MKRLALILVVMALCGFRAGAQNNAYSIDDECFTWFTQAENTVDDFESDAFDTAQQMLLETSLRKKDTKAQTLYYVEQLKHTSHLAQHVRKQDEVAWDNISWNARVEKDKETLQRIAKATGYTQYYYYATELCQTYYFNTSQNVLAGEMLTAMMEEAKANNDEYAMWKTLIYLEKLYQRIGDQYSTQKYLSEVVRIYETTDDPTIRRQSMTIQLCELADTYHPASDSARMYYRMAEASCRTKLDTMRVTYYKAQLAAWDGKLDEYRKDRDFCLSMALFPSVILSGKQCFDCIDNIIAGKPTESFRNSINALYLRQQFSFTAALASHMGQWETAAKIRLRHIERLYSNIYHYNSQRLDQMTAQFENNRLTADLAEASQKVTRTTIWLAVLLAIILVGALLFSILHVRSLKKVHAKDEARLAELQRKYEESK